MMSQKLLTSISAFTCCRGGQALAAIHRMPLPLGITAMALGIGLEGAVVVLALREDPSLTWPRFVALHLLAAAVYAVGLTRSAGEAHGLSWGSIGFALAFAAFPGYGMLAVGTASGLWAFLRWRVGLPDAPDLEPLTALEDDPLRAALAGPVPSLLESLDVRPLPDEMKAGDVMARQRTIDTMIRLLGPQAAGLLHDLVRDPAPEIRLYASIGLTKLEDQATKAVLQAQQQLEDAPASVLAHLAVADCYFAYGTQPLADRTMRRFYLDLARQEYQNALGLEPANRQARTALARTYLELGDPQSAQDLLTAIVDADLQDPESRLLQMRALYDLGQYGRLPSLAGDLLHAAPEDGAGLEPVRWWSAAGAKVEQP